MNPLISKKLQSLELASYIQFTLINPDVTRQQMTKHLNLCKEFQFNAAMIAPCWISLARGILKNTSVKVTTFIDFGMGNAAVSGKVALIEDLKDLGAEEVDFAPNMGFFLSGMYDEFLQESTEIVLAAGGMPVKAMLQIGMIKEIGEKKRAVQLLEKAGVDWIKNSSGGWPPGATKATVEDIRLIKDTVTGKSRVKASGGINDYDTAIALIEAGAELLGTSYGPEILKGAYSEDHSSPTQTSDY